MTSTIDQNSAEKPGLPWKTFLVPTDFSEPSKEAAETAARLAGQCGAKIVLLHVVQLPPSCPADAALDVDELVNRGRECLEVVSAQIPSALLQEKLVRLAGRETAQEIIGVARNVSADLIVMATHGYNGLKRLWLGSTAEKVMRHAPCPILVTRRKEIAPESNPDSPHGS